MKEIIFVTSNKGKYNSAKVFFKTRGIKVIQKSLDTPESRGSIEEIAGQKVKYAYQLLNRPLIAMDAGFFIYSLNGFPRMFTNFILETIGLEGIIRLTKGKDKSCEFKEVLAFLDNPRKEPRLFERRIKGRISLRPLGKLQPYHWSKLALIFIPGGEKKTLAEMSKKEFTEFRKRVDQNSHWEQLVDFISKLK